MNFTKRALFFVLWPLFDILSDQDTQAGKNNKAEDCAHPWTAAMVHDGHPDAIDHDLDNFSCFLDKISMAVFLLTYVVLTVLVFINLS